MNGRVVSKVSRMCLVPMQRNGQRRSFLPMEAMSQ